MKNSSSYFENRECEYFPCHKNAGEHFNCLFCFCPLYALGSECGGNFSYTEQGVKDCSACLIPHSEKGHEHVFSKLGKVSELAKKG